MRDSFLLDLAEHTHFIGIWKGLFSLVECTVHSFETHVFNLEGNTTLLVYIPY